ncbi:hypothetical protein BGZ54_007335 [Gamsiella multidivaricata]|nr:hypothetical protein BGZ54_007335 [Gamsiella multidivaricata]
MSPRQREQLQATPISEIVVLHSKSWTQAEREALYLATARFRLMGRWSKIREIMNLHRTDQEIETEYMKLYGPRDDIDVVDDEDEAEAERSYKRGYSSYTENDKENEDIGTMRMGEDRFGSMDGDADDEAEGPMFIKFRGARRAASTTSSSQEKRGQQEQNNSRVFKSVYEHQPILGPRPRPAILKEPIRLHKKELMIDKQFALEEIPMRL